MLKRILRTSIIKADPERNTIDGGLSFRFSSCERKAALSACFASTTQQDKVPLADNAVLIFTRSRKLGGTNFDGMCQTGKRRYASNV